MNAQELKRAIEKAFRANTHKVEVEVGQYGQTEEEEQIENIEELKEDIFSIIDKNFTIGKIDKREIFIGTGKIGASYNISDAIEVAKKWGFKYVSWNAGEIVKLNGDRTKYKYDEL